MRKGLKGGLDLNRAAISQYLSLNHTTTRSCIVQGVNKVPPATYVEIHKNQSPKLVRYWDLAEIFCREKLRMTDREATEHLANLIDQSVRQRLCSDVPLGSFLSAGIDSACITESMKRQASESQGTPQAYSMGFFEAEFDETKGAAETADAIGIKMISQKSSVNLAECLTKIIESFDEPFADTSMIPTYQLCGFAREHVKVSLSGDGGDELQYGYNRHIYWYYLHELP